MITQVPGIKVGHATDQEHHTGCTVILCPEGTVGGVDVRGPSPGTRETALLGPYKHVQDVTAVLLTGGSAFGLAAADGVVRFLEENNLGHWTPRATVPIVPAAVVYDLFFSEGKRRPDAEMGYQACQAAEVDAVAQGNVGVGAGVTVGKWAGFEGIMKGGFGTASDEIELEGGEKLIVGAAAVTNCVGDILNVDGTVLAGARSSDGLWFAENDPLQHLTKEPEIPDGTNTTLIVAATNAALTKVDVNRLASHAQNGLVMAIRPPHTTHDGDTAFTLATGQVDARFDLIAYLVEFVVAEAIRNSVRYATTLEGIPGLASDPR
ncbi:MAG: P1 family peptidase [Anaerolineales bacterium]